MTDEVGHMQVTGITEHEDGGATIEFDMDDTTAALAQELGLKLLIYCGATGTNVDYVFDSILGRDPYIREFDDEEKQRSKEREEANKSDTCVSCGTILPTPSKSAWCGFCLEEE